ncbi:isoaspartyl peptidase/L-asparaginase family protein [Sporocytophaga myxococcoides]|uniref:isoaspartyl peptidase/L-asparaginase family protein n=1 Tax=Sporocytophaga myxococcoides TaxID=153721 RepID=UPI001B7FD208|nr:isoaspartyl peptidase/L-asparaginase [Sporocytophaga myxococcoides]
METIQTATSKGNIVLLIHGGAGNFKESDLSPGQQRVYEKYLHEAVEEGYKILEEGGSSLDAVEAAVKIMEDAPVFNAGKGSVLNKEGHVEMDASIMSGKDLKAGAVAMVRHVKNPISAARMVMEKSNHVLLAGSGADEYARSIGMEMKDESYFITPSSLEQWKKANERVPDPKGIDKHGTVGAVALDLHGNLAAATSTGGILNKLTGRIGDSPIIGAGTYADNNTCAVSATGHGEYFIRLTVARSIAALMEYKKISLELAVNEVIQDRLSKLGGNGGVIAVDKNGNFSIDHNTTGMFRAWKTEKKCEVRFFKE